MRSMPLAASAALSLLFAVPAGAHEVEEALDNSARSTSPIRATPRCRRSCSARSRCCIRSGTRPARRRSATSSKDDPQLRDRHLGHRVDPDVQPAGRTGRVAEGRRDGAGGDRARPPHRREDRARARLHRGGRRLLRRLRERARSASARLSRAQAYEALAAQAIPDDDEAQIFAALYIAGTQSQADQTYAAYLKAAAVLEKQFAKYPDHPGVAHYLIHSYDAPPIASKGLAAARRYPTIAPDCAACAAHAVAHLHAGRRVAGLGRARTSARSTWQKDGNGRRGLPRGRLHGLRVPAARPRPRRAASSTR